MKYYAKKKKKQPRKDQIFSNIFRKIFVVGLSGFWKGHFYTLANARVWGSWSHCGAADHLGLFGDFPCHHQLVSFVCFFLFYITRVKRNSVSEPNSECFPTPNRTVLFPPGEEYRSFWLIFSWLDHCHLNEYYAPIANKIQNKNNLQPKTRLTESRFLSRIVTRANQCKDEIQ